MALPQRLNKVRGRTVASMYSVRPRSVEPLRVPEIYCSGIGSVTLIDGGVICLSLYRNVSIGGALEPRTVAHVIGPVDGIPRAVGQILAVAGGALAQLRGTAIAAAPGDTAMLRPKEYFVTELAMQCEPEFVRLMFYSDRAAVSLVVPPMAFNRMASQIAIGPDCPLH